ncbi:MAG: DUF2508 family protein [Oscillospiraceae bacterium]
MLKKFPFISLYLYNEEKLKKEKELKDKNQFLNQINQVKINLDNARLHFDMETDFDMLDARIYEIKALETTYDCLIRQAKSQHIINENLISKQCVTIA